MPTEFHRENFIYVGVITYLIISCCVTPWAAENPAIRTLEGKYNGEAAKEVTLKHGDFVARISTLGARINYLGTSNIDWIPLASTHFDADFGAVDQKSGFAIALGEHAEFSPVNWQIESIHTSPGGPDSVTFKHVCSPLPGDPEGPLTVWIEFRLQEVSPFGAGAFMSNFNGELSISIFTQKTTSHNLKDLSIQHQLVFDKRDTIRWHLDDSNKVLAASENSVRNRYFSIHSECDDQWRITNQTIPFTAEAIHTEMSQPIKRDDYRSKASYRFPGLDLNLHLLFGPRRNSVTVIDNSISNTMDYSRKIYPHPLQKKVIKDRQLIDTITMNVWIEGNVAF